MDLLPENRDSAAVLAGEAPAAAVVGEKRPGENGDAEAWATKKQRVGGGGKLRRRVAEIVLVLSAMSRIRGGKVPTEVEVRLMAEAREKLAELCQGLAPKDLVAKDAVGAVIEDLGLNSKAKDQKLGFRGPRLTIAEKFAQAKKKMEDSKKYTAQSSSYASQPTHTGFNPSSEIRGTSHITRPIQSDKPSYQQFHSVGPSSSSPHVGHISTAMPTSVSYQIPTTNDVKPASGNLPARIDRTHVKVEGGLNVPSSYASQGQVNSLNAQSIKPQTWSVRPQAPKIGPELNNKMTHIPLKVDLTPQMGVPRMTPLPPRDQNFMPFAHQPSPGTLPIIHHQPIQPNYSQHSSLSNSHNEIAKIVQKLLQPKLPDHPTWIPPSRDYMNKALVCQICQVTVNDVDSVLVCDACEKGYHMKCTPPTNQRGIPRGEWHCSRCLAVSNGKPLPPKYGRVMRSGTQMKVPMSTDGVQPLPEQKEGPLEPKVNKPKGTEIGGPSLQNPGTEADSKSPSSKGTEKDEKPVLESCENSSLKSSEPASASSTSESCAQKGAEIGSSGPQNAPSQTGGVDLGSENVGTDLDSKGLNPQDTEKGNSSPTVGEKHVLGNCENSSLQSSETIGLSESSAQLVNEAEPSLCKEESVELKPVDTDNLSDSVVNLTEFSQQSQHSSVLDQSDQPNSTTDVPEKPQDHNPIMPTPDNLKLDENREGNVMDNSKQDEQDSGHGKSSESQIIESAENFSDGSPSVEFIGDPTQTDEEKTFYTSCRVNGVLYKLQDHVHLQSVHGKLTPSKIQSMWEDGKTGLKYVHAGKYVFPSDLPENHGRPCSSDTNEVYESNQSITAIIGDIMKGPCEILPQTQFEEESQRRSQLDLVTSSELPPLYLCRWLYDEVKESFQPISG